MRVLLTGANGQVGEAVRLLAPAETELRALTRAELDLRDEAAVWREVGAFAPDVIINAAAYTAVDQAESEPETAAAINASGPRCLALAAQATPGCRLLHVSTDYVFDGCAEKPYRPEDTPRPLSVYGSSKLAGERAVLGLLPERAAILRTAWVYAPHGRNFLLTMLRLMRERGVVRVVADQRGTPTAAASVAQALWRLAERPGVHGILHWTDAGVTSWYGFACAIAEEAVVVNLLNGPVAVEPITTADYPTPARRPANSILETAQSGVLLGLTPLPWRTQLRVTLRSMAGPHGQ